MFLQVYHIITRHVFDPAPPQWRLVDEVDTALVKQIEEMAKDPLELICCARCGHKTCRARIISHLLYE